MLTVSQVQKHLGSTHLNSTIISSTILHVDTPFIQPEHIQQTLESTILVFNRLFILLFSIASLDPACALMVGPYANSSD